ncbi:DJ-1/PfpI family protein [Clostridium estertheticum]|uniref:DJ-1/PfpI family protein n=1 Tax=Clostridium estertheticum TaxID=238834 RepID=A0AA47I7Z9_9CLOT|nr:DJ-1/PfpI family protein [Clostridium estertheticum]MBU3153694.1 DJ-1/PfpI family protein [Clostridium estertheticum]MBU3174871.1 DJ-1/PfpI family protein [Clostridium estertheticum]MBU3200179.1 DJ-1/PfpI family protein [Clostridium estertheticum]WAG61520.1 DJ-1/PfpI family protein [Clostridium estertheticum]WAG64353.1 DJ-1/PfpI family protein [Clostridium estertheticum]
MKKILCFISDEFADFEITLVLHKIRNVGKRHIVTVGYNHKLVVSESGLCYKPDLTLNEVIKLDDVEGLIIPGGPIRNQQEELTKLILKLDQEKRMIAAICNGSQYLGRAGILNKCKFTTSCSLERIEALGVVDPFPRENYEDSRVVTDKNIITAKGRAFVDFSFAVFDYLNIYEGQYTEKEKLFIDIMNR